MNLRRRSRDTITYTDILLARNEEEAEILLRKYVNANPTDIAAYIRLGDILRRRNLIEEAIRIHKSLIKPRLETKIKIRVLQSLVDDFFTARKFRESIPYLKEIVNIAPRNDLYLNMLVGIYEQAEMWEEALVIRRKIGDRKKLACVRALYGKFLLDKDQEREAVQNFNKALKLDPSCIPALLYMGDMKYKESDIDSAIELWQDIIKNSPEFAFLIFDRLENAYFEKKSYHDMVDIYESCIQISGSIEAHRRLAELYYKLGEKEKAIDILSKIFERSRDELTAYQLIETYKRDGDYQSIVEVIEEILKGRAEGSMYECSKCNSEFNEFHFRCDRCFEWLTLKEKIRK